MLIEKIIKEILKRNNSDEVLFVSLCGWADTGKTTLAKKICAELINSKIESDYISTDSFMIERDIRNQKGISGYNIASLKEECLKHCISELKRKTETKYFQYDNKLGRNSANYRIIRPSKVIIVEGIHSFNQAIINQIDLRIYIDASTEILEELRFNANIKKRGFTDKEARLRIEQEMEEYNKFVFPNKKYAHINIGVNNKYQYDICNN